MSWPERTWGSDDDHLWCEECDCITNHRTAQHFAAIADLEEHDATDDRFAVRHDAYKDGADL